MTKDNATPRPWDYGYKTDKYSPDGELLIIQKKSVKGMQKVICGSFCDNDAEANAKLIVKAVNCHD